MPRRPRHGLLKELSQKISLPLSLLPSPRSTPNDSVTKLVAVLPLVLRIQALAEKTKTKNNKNFLRPPDFISLILKNYESF